MGKTISRQEAIRLLYDLSDSEFLNEELSKKLLEISNILEQEQYGIHAWEIPQDDYYKIVVAYRDDLTKEIEEKIKTIKKHKFGLSDYEKENIDEMFEFEEEED